MDNSSNSLWCDLLFCICCYYSYMLRANLINYFASVRYYNLCCTAGVLNVTNYVGLKIRKDVKFLQFLCFFHF